MDGMQQRITRVLEETGLMERIPGLEFFELAEKLYPEDADTVAVDEFARHFNKVCPFPFPTLLSLFTPLLLPSSPLSLSLSLNLVPAICRNAYIHPIIKNPLTNALHRSPPN